MLPPNDLQCLLNYSSLFVGNLQTMATEAAVLGIPAVRCNSFPGSKKEMSNFIELEKEYNLLNNFNYKDKDKAIDRALELFKDKTQKKIHDDRKHKLLSSKIDVTEYMVNFIEKNYQ